MHLYDAFMTLDYQKVLPACHHGFYIWYVQSSFAMLGRYIGPVLSLIGTVSLPEIEVGGTTFDLVPPPRMVCLRTRS